MPEKVEMREQKQEVQKLSGVVAIILALFLLSAPGMTVAAGAATLFMFIILFGIFALMEGIAAIFIALSQREGSWLLQLLFGAVSAFVGLEALRHPIAIGVVTANVVIFIIMLKLIAGGIIQIVTAFQYRGERSELLGRLMGGALGLVFGLVLLSRGGTLEENPATLIRITAYYMLLSGAVQFMLSRARRS